MKSFICLISILAAGAVVGCGGTQVDPATRQANNEDRAQELCHSTARSKHLRVSSSEEPYAMGNSRYVVNFKTRDAGGTVSRRCDVDLAHGRAVIY